MTTLSRRVVLATGNEGKRVELVEMLGPLNIEIVSQVTLGVVPCEETGGTFIENAIQKARHAAAVSGLPAIADDSGLEVDALAGQPGVRSARFAGEQASDQDNIEKLLSTMSEVDESLRGCAFRCAMVFMRNADDPAPLVANGIWRGRILRAAQGNAGFGYDPVFYVPEHDCAAAELGPGVKNTISHRALAMRQLVPQLQSLYADDARS